MLLLSPQATGQVLCETLTLWDSSAPSQSDCARNPPEWQDPQGGHKSFEPSAGDCRSSDSGGRLG